MVNACTVNPPIFPRTDIPKLTVAGSPGFGNVSGEVSTALSSACRETDSRNNRREEPQVSGGPHPFFHRFTGERILRTIGGRSPGVSRGQSRPVFYLFIREPDSQNHGPAAQPVRFRIDRNSPNESRGFSPPRLRPERRRPGERTEDRPGGPARAIGTGSIPRSRRTWRRPRGIHPGIAR